MSAFRPAAIAMPVILVLATLTVAPNDAGVFHFPASPRPTPTDLSVPFMENIGQAPEGARFTAATFAGTVAVTESGEILYTLPVAGPSGSRVVLRERAATTSDTRVSGGEHSAARISVFRGNDAERWRSAIPTFSTVRIDGLARGVALELAAGGRNVEKCFHIAAGADLAALHMTIEGAESLRVTDDGELEVMTAAGPLNFTRPVAFQECDGRRAELPARYVVSDHGYGFVVDGYDAALPLLIDPLIASTYVGGEHNDWVEDIAIAGDSVYVAGRTRSLSFALTSPEAPGAYQDNAGGYTDAFVCRLTSDLTTLEALTYLGGDQEEQCHGIAVTADHVFIAGRTRVGDTTLTDFPIVGPVVQPDRIDSPGNSDGFVARFNRELTELQRSTFLGGAGIDQMNDVLVDPTLHVIVLGFTRSDDWPPPNIIGGEQRKGVSDVVVLRLDEGLSAFEAGVMFGGAHGDDPERMALSGNDLFLCGATNSSDLVDYFPTSGVIDEVLTRESDGFVARVDADDLELQALTYLGGEVAEYPQDRCTDVAATGGRVYVCGTTDSEDFPTTPGALQPAPNIGQYDQVTDGFVVRLNRDFTSLLAGTHLGGLETDRAHALALHEHGVVVVGSSGSNDFPLPPHAEDKTVNDRDSDAFAIALDDDLTRAIDGRFVGGDAFDVAKAVLLTGDTALIAGETSSENFPVTPGAFQEDYQDDSTRPDTFVTGLPLDFGGTEPPPIVIDSYILPKRLDVRHNVKKPEKSWLNAGGWFDTGTGEVDFTRPATLTVGETQFDIPRLETWRKTWWRHVEGRVDFRIKPSKYGSSKAKFKLKMTGLDVQTINPDEALTLHFVNGDVDAIGEVTLKQGRYKLGRQRGALIQPPLALYSCKTKVKGESKDAIRARLGLSTEGGAPSEAPDLDVTMGGTFNSSIPAQAFDPKKRKFIYSGEKGDVTKCTLDYGKEKLSIHAKKIDTGAFDQGAQDVPISIQLGPNEIVLRVRMFLKGKTMRY